MEELRAEAVVVGAGVHGSSAALHLARAGKDTILLEQFPLPHSRGSSHGQTRIIRLANYGVPALTSIMADSFSKWRRLEQESGDSLLRPTPMLVLGEEKAITRVARSVREGGQRPIHYTSSEVKRKYGMNLSDGHVAIVDPSAGVLMADKCVAAMQRLFRAAGGRVVDEWPVEGVEVEADGVVEVRGRRGRVRAPTVILCPGPWAGPLLAKMGVYIPLEVKRISVFYWRIKDEATPTINFVDLSENDHRYGIAQLEYPGLMKVVYHSGPATTPEERDLQGASEELKEGMMKYVKVRLPFLRPVPAVEESCLYTVTPDEEFVVDRHPSHPNIIYACGFSGTGFKIAPVLGEELCRLAMGQSPLHDLSAFSASRFHPRSKM